MSAINENNIINIDDALIKQGTAGVSFALGDKTYTMPVLPRSMVEGSLNGVWFDVDENSIKPNTPCLKISASNGSRILPLLVINDPLTFTLLEDMPGGGIRLDILYIANIYQSLRWRSNVTTEWQDAPKSYDNTWFIPFEHKGDFVQFECGLMPLPDTSGGIFDVTLDAEDSEYAPIAVSGSVQSLVGYSQSTKYLAAFQGTFGLYGAGNIYNYIAVAPDLPATTLTDSCYSSMFKDCGILTYPPHILPAQMLKPGCYINMFSGCAKITESPQILATTLAQRSCAYMFKGCSSLHTIRVHFTDWFDSGALAGEYKATYNWVDGVAPKGTFYKPSALPLKRGIDYIPEGWDVVNID